MSVSIWQNKNAFAPTSNINADITIIGAGLAGLSVAYWLTQEDPTLKIAILEKGIIGNGASGRNAGFITCGSVEHFSRLCKNHGKDEAHKIWKFSETNLSLLKEHIIDGHESELMFEHKGSFSLASTDIEFSELKESQKLMQSLGINVETLIENEIKQRLGAHGFVGGIKYVDDASIHPVRLLHKLLEKVTASKQVTLYENNEVYRVEAQGEIRVVQTNQHSFHSPCVIFATNGYSPQLHDYFKDKISPTRGQILSTAPVERFMEGPCYANFVLDYFRQLPTGELVIGGFRQLQKDAEVGYSDETTDVIQKALEKFIQDHLPKLKDTPIIHRWSGIMGFSSDGNPMLGSLPTDSQIYYLGGFTAHGLGLTFHSGKCLVDLIFGREVPKFISGKRF